MRLYSRGKEAAKAGMRSKNRRGSEAKIDGHVGKGQSRIAHFKRLAETFLAYILHYTIG